MTAEALTWEVARAGGLVAYALLALAVLLGLALSLRLQHPAHWPRLVNYELHRHLTLLALVFTLVHVVAVAVDPYTAFRLVDVLVPFVTPYRTLSMSLGIVAAYLGIAVGVTSLLQARVGYRVWRALHHLAFAVFALATVHGLGTGSDTRTLWAVLLYGVASAAVAALVLLRLARGAATFGRRAAALGVVAGVAALAAYAWAGPLRLGWTHATARVPARVADPALPAFTATFRGRVVVEGGGRLVVRGTLSGGARGTLALSLTGISEDAAFVVRQGSVRLVLAAPAGGTWQGRLLGGDAEGDLLAGLAAPGERSSTLALALTLDRQAVVGTVRTAPSSPPPTGDDAGGA